jgi:GT2 family glycosyltransferase
LLALKNMGYKVMYCAESKYFMLAAVRGIKKIHLKPDLNFRNNLLLLKKNLPFGRSFFTISIRFVLDLLAITRFMGEGKRKDAWHQSRASKFCAYYVSL